MIEKRFTLVYGIDETPFEWDIMDNQKDILIVSANGTSIVDLLNELHEENMMLKQPHCRKCEYFSSDNADCYCMKKGFNSIDDFNIAKNCKDYMSVLE